jgi:hypothetical protein
MSVAVEVRREDWGRRGLSKILPAGGSGNDLAIFGSLVHPDNWPAVEAALAASGLPHRVRLPGSSEYTAHNGADWGGTR